jgi:hypothetical protein
MNILRNLMVHAHPDYPWLASSLSNNRPAIQLTKPIISLVENMAHFQIKWVEVINQISARRATE